MPTRPGSAVSPVPSSVRYLAGTADPAGRIAAILAPSSSNVASSIGAAPVPSMIRKCWIAICPAGRLT